MIQQKTNDILGHQNPASIHGNSQNIDDRQITPIFKASTVWTQKDLEILRKQYLKIGSSWLQISQKIQNKSAVEIKNKFNNSIRKIAKMLATFQREKMNKQRDYISKDKLLKVLEFVNQTQKTILNLEFSINWQSKIFSFKKQLLQLSLGSELFSKERIQCFVKLTKFITYKIRTFSIFKIKNLKNFRIDEKALNLVLGFDKIILEDVYKLVLGTQYHSLQDRQENQGIKSEIHNLCSFPQIPVKRQFNVESQIQIVSNDDAILQRSIFNCMQWNHYFNP